jgi:prolipoprotein diacylglyceryl transferase
MGLMTIITYIIWDVSPEIVRIADVVSIRWYGVMWALGLILSRQVGIYIFHREDKCTEHLHELFFYIVIPAIIGARLGHFVFYDPVVLIQNPLEVILPPYEGLASHGGALGILIGVYIFARRKKYNYLWVIDRLAIVAPIPGATIRFGNLMNSEIVGLPTDVPWAFIFRRLDNVPRHPAQLYEAVFCLLLFGLLFWVWRKYSHKTGDGFILGLLMVVLWSFRFISEMFKENQVSFENDLPLNMGQFLSIFFIALGVVLIILSLRKLQPSPSPPSP